MTSKTRDDVREMFLQVLAGRSHKLHPGKDKDTINNWIDFLDSFGSDIGYRVLQEYQYDDTDSDFFSWPRIVKRLKLKLSERYPDEDDAWETFINLVIRKGFINPPLPNELEPELAQFINENGGWVDLCHRDSESLEKLFRRKYLKIINTKVSKIVMEKLNESD